MTGALTQTIRPQPWARSLAALKLAVAIMIPEGGAAAQARTDFAQTPTPRAVARRMLEIGGAGPGETVADLGSGDGRIVILAAQEFGARSIGVELDRELHRKAAANAKAAGVAERATLLNGDLFDVDLSGVTVVTVYLLPSLMMRLRARILEQMRPGTRVVSHEFAMGAWRPDLSEVFLGRTLHLWVVPAHVAGRWRLTTPYGTFMLDVVQAFQEVTGSAHSADSALPLLDTSLWGSDIGFSMILPGNGLRRFRGRVDGRTISAMPFDEASAADPELVARWNAVR
jgi:hypothetical protein